jgi:type IV secretory pathway VirJ component
MTKKLSPAERRARAAAIVAEAERTGKGIIAAIETVNRRTFGETTASRPALKAPKPSKRARRIAEAVSEALTAHGAPTLPPGTTPAAARKPAAKAPAPAAKPHEMSDDELASSTLARSSTTAASPFWRAQEAAPAASVTETVAADPDALTGFTGDELAARYAERGRGFGSPLWAA